MYSFGRLFDLPGVIEVGEVIIVEVESVDYSKDDSKFFFFSLGSLAQV